MAEFLMSADDFEEYVLSFYTSRRHSTQERDGKDGLYPLNCSDDTIRSAISLVVTAGMNSETFAADSLSSCPDGHAAFLFVIELPAYDKFDFWAYELEGVTACPGESEVHS